MRDEAATAHAILVRIEGRVQGVWYRGWAVEQATARGLRGWVRNRADGSVEALFAGPEAVVNAMLLDCQKGPPAARVTKVQAASTAVPTDPVFRALPTL